MGSCAPQARENGQDLAVKTQAGGLTGSTHSSAGDLETHSPLLGSFQGPAPAPCSAPRDPRELPPNGPGFPEAKATPSAWRILGKVQPKHVPSQKPPPPHQPCPSSLLSNTPGAHSQQLSATREGGDRVTSALTAKSQPSPQLYCLCPPGTS